MDKECGKFKVRDIISFIGDCPFRKGYIYEIVQIKLNTKDIQELELKQLYPKQDQGWYYWNEEVYRPATKLEKALL